MKHNIRINGEIKEIDCELGSGVYDKNGREIFEGDIVYAHEAHSDTYPFKIVFAEGCFPLEPITPCKILPVLLHAWSNTFLEKVND